MTVAVVLVVVDSLELELEKEYPDGDSGGDVPFFLGESVRILCPVPNPYELLGYSSRRHTTL